MKTIRIGCGSGGCAYERLEPVEELLDKGRLDYLVFECLAERTIAEAQRARLHNPAKGYNPMLEERMRRILPSAAARGVRIVSNMGGANTEAAVEAVLHIAAELGLHGLKVAAVYGDDILDRVRDYYDVPLWDRKAPLRSLDGTILSANVYLGAQPIREALDAGADMVITGRVADPALFVGPLQHEFDWDVTAPDRLGQALLTGHLMECCGQLTGGYYADPGFKDVKDLHRLGFPVAEVSADGDAVFTKPEGSGGTVCVDVCKEQLLYEIGDPSCYITPDGIADFSRVTFTQIGPDRVRGHGAICRGRPDTFKVNIGYSDCFTGEAAVSFGGSNALNRARLAADIVARRLEIVGVTPQEYRVDYIGCNSLYGDAISAPLTPQPPAEIRLRIAARTRTREEAEAVVREVNCLYINGPAGACALRSRVEQGLSVENILIPAGDVVPRVVYHEV